jgi:hypothetical protein
MKNFRLEILQYLADHDNDGFVSCSAKLREMIGHEDYWVVKEPLLKMIEEGAIGQVNLFNVEGLGGQSAGQERNTLHNYEIELKILPYGYDLIREIKREVNQDSLNQALIATNKSNVELNGKTETYYKNSFGLTLVIMFATVANVIIATLPFMARKPQPPAPISIKLPPIQIVRDTVVIHDTVRIISNKGLKR